MALNKNKDLKMYFNIGEVSQLLDLPETLLRFWEKEFPNIKPNKVGRGIRQYTKDDIEQIKIVRHLVKERGMTLQGARDTLKHGGGRVGTDRTVDVVERLKSIRDDLQSIGRELGALV